MAPAKISPILLILLSFPLAIFASPQGYNYGNPPPPPSNDPSNGYGGYGGGDNPPPPPQPSVWNPFNPFNPILPGPVIPNYTPPVLPGLGFPGIGVGGTTKQPGGIATPTATPGNAGGGYTFVPPPGPGGPGGVGVPTTTLLSTALVTSTRLGIPSVSLPTSLLPIPPLLCQNPVTLYATTTYPNSVPYISTYTSLSTSLVTVETTSIITITQIQTQSFPVELTTTSISSFIVTETDGVTTYCLGPTPPRQTGLSLSLSAGLSASTTNSALGGFTTLVSPSGGGVGVSVSVGGNGGLPTPTPSPSVSGGGNGGGNGGYGNLPPPPPPPYYGS